MQNRINQIKRAIEEVGATFDKKDEKWVCLIDGHIVAIDRLQGECIFKAAKELGECA